jgi:hypothetical protein
VVGGRYAPGQSGKCYAPAIEDQRGRGRLAATSCASRMYGRRSVVKASFRRNRGKGAWVRHARYLARERAQHEHDRGQGFDAVHEGLDIAATVRTGNAVTS